MHGIEGVAATIERSSAEIRGLVDAALTVDPGLRFIDHKSNDKVRRLFLDWENQLGVTPREIQAAFKARLQSRYYASIKNRAERKQSVARKDTVLTGVEALRQIEESDKRRQVILRQLEQLKAQGGAEQPLAVGPSPTRITKPAGPV